MAIKLTKELLDDEAKNLASVLAIVNGDKETTSNQIRKFYNDFLLLKAKSDINDDEKYFKEKILPLISFSKAKIYYALGRETITPTFANQLTAKISSIETKEDFDNFILFYQAVIGFFTYEKERLKKEAAEKKNQNQDRNRNNNPRRY